MQDLTLFPHCAVGSTERETKKASRDPRGLTNRTTDGSVDVLAAYETSCSRYTQQTEAKQCQSCRNRDWRNRGRAVKECLPRRERAGDARCQQQLISSRNSRVYVEIDSDGIANATLNFNKHASAVVSVKEIVSDAVHCEVHYDRGGFVVHGNVCTYEGAR